MSHKYTLILALLTAAMLTACGGSDSLPAGTSTPTTTPTPGPGDNQGSADDNQDNTDGNNPAARVFKIMPGTENPTEQAQIAFTKAGLGDTIKFGCGFFNIKDTLLLTHTEGVTITGCGMNKTILSFRNSNATVGILVNSASGIVIKDLTVADTGGNGFELRSVDHGTLRGVRAFWSSGGGRFSETPLTAQNYQGENSPFPVACTDPATQNPNVPENQLIPGADTTSPDYTVSQKSGRYGIYPVKSSNILIADSVSIGASDAGIYVGQTNTAIIRDSRAAFNVFGFEIENVRHGEYYGNLAECNTGGFLIYDLDNLTRYGGRTIMRDNISRMNNTYNFSSGGFVSKVPAGSGMITLAYDRIDIYDNKFLHNNTAGIIITSYAIFPEGGQPTDNKIDFYSDGVEIYNNTFKDNGNNLPNLTTTALTEGKVAQLLPFALGLKTGVACLLNPGKCPTLTNPPQDIILRGAHIIWDGLQPGYHPDCPYPTDANGNRLPEDPYIDGKPKFTAAQPNPACHYNKYKFNVDAAGNATRKTPMFAPACIHDNRFSADSVQYSNFHGTKGLEAALVLLGDKPLQTLLQPETLEGIVGGLTKFAANLDMSIHDCQQRFGTTLPPIEPVVIAPFEPSGDFNPAPSQAEIAKLCNADTPIGTVNWAASVVNCPRLSQYNLFQNPDNPTSQPNSQGFPYVLNTKLFSDYAVKYRVIFLPPGKQAIYHAPGASAPAGTIKFPVGTIIAKTFSFLDSGVETPIETRLLIKRETPNGKARWHAVSYIWQMVNGEKVALMDVTGKDNISVSWHYKNAHTGKLLAGSTNGYSVPSANQCVSCHANKNRPAGSPPIGPKVRNMNRAYKSESTVVTAQSRHPIAGNNQIYWMCHHGMMRNCPDITLSPNGHIATNLARLPKFNVPGDSGAPAGSDADIEARVRAYLETNCAHCHNPRGFAANTGLYFDSFRPVNTSFGICKGPTAAGVKGTGGRTVDIMPGSANASILSYRTGAGSDKPVAMMPPIARSVVHQKAHQLIRKWINNVVDASYAGANCVAN